MNRILLYGVIWSVLLLGATADLVAYYPHLPEKVATHFNGAGEADGWGTRQGFLGSWFFSVGFAPALILGSVAAVKYLPARWINVPHRDYWLAPGRSEYTRMVMADMIQRIGVAVFLFIALLNHFMMRANLTPHPNLGPWPWILLVGLFTAMAIIIIPPTRRFRRRC
jgi:uncharacterized membrane protein